MSEADDEPKPGIETEIHGLVKSNTELTDSVRALAAGLRFGRKVVIGLVLGFVVLVAVVAVLSVIAVKVNNTQDEQGRAAKALAVVQNDLRGIQCDTATLWLSLLDLPQPEPDPPLTAEEQVQADAALAEFKATYEAIYESLDCEELAR